jgi:hypothetical protein
LKAKTKIFLSKKEKVVQLKEVGDLSAAGVTVNESLLVWRKIV